MLSIVEQVKWWPSLTNTILQIRAPLTWFFSSCSIAVLNPLCHTGIYVQDLLISSKDMLKLTLQQF